MVLIEDAARLRDVDAVRVELRPRQVDQPVEIGADHLVLGRRLRHPLEPLELLLGLVLRLLRHAGLLDRLAQLLDLGGLVVAFVEFLLDLAQLLTQNVLALLRGKRLLRLLADRLGQLQHLDALDQQRKHLVEALLDIERLQDVLLLGGLHVQQAGDEICKRRGRVQAVDRGCELRRHVLQQPDGLACTFPQQVHARLDVRRHDLARADLLDAGDEIGIVRNERDDAEASHAATDHVMRSVRRGDVAQDLRDGPDLVQLLGRRILGSCVGLQQHADHALRANDLLGRRDGCRPADRQRQHHAGKQHRLAHRQNNETVLRKRMGLAVRCVGIFLLRCVGHDRPQPCRIRCTARHPLTSSDRITSNRPVGSRTRRSKRP
jgi:hypothetical protein